jgi:uncharacterized protein
MAETLKGGKKTTSTNMQRHGADFYRRIGRKGGKARVPKGFAVNRELASKAGFKGGCISSRKGVPNKPKELISKSV